MENEFGWGHTFCEFCGKAEHQFKKEVVLYDTFHFCSSLCARMWEMITHDVAEINAVREGR
jgi:hypothetical protein